MAIRLLTQANMSGGRIDRAVPSPRQVVLMAAQMSVDRVSRARRALSREAPMAAAIEVGDSGLCASRSRIIQRFGVPLYSSTPMTLSSCSQDVRSSMPGSSTSTCISTSRMRAVSSARSR